MKKVCLEIGYLSRKELLSERELNDLLLEGEQDSNEELNTVCRDILVNKKIESLLSEMDLEDKEKLVIDLFIWKMYKNDMIARKEQCIDENKKYGKAKENSYIEGWYEGESKGIEKEKTTTIMEMYNKGFELKMISEVTGYTVERVQEVIDSLYE